MFTHSTVVTVMSDLKFGRRDVSDIGRLSTLTLTQRQSTKEFIYLFIYFLYFNLFTFAEPAVSQQNTLTLHVILTVY